LPPSVARATIEPTGGADEGSEMGAKFWLGVVGITAALAIGGLILFLLIGWAWYAWGFVGMFIFFAAIALLLAWISDKRTERRYRELGET
jgi:Kef-type K+ transport system membrane component KefB